MTKSNEAGKGSSRRKENVRAISDNWDLIFGVKKEKSKMDAWNQFDNDDEDELICEVCNSPMTGAENGAYLFCDVCGHREDYEWDDSNA